ncbi:GyrI-like domain-containing protein [Robiginitalea sp. IMCC44478]|uniref:GyrI-like domain-containing protein n=1 Tax=Robiginitalea sp. IMCC44478 TaxID=3459122 RepID=UPI0040433A18
MQAGKRQNPRNKKIPVTKKPRIEEIRPLLLIGIHCEMSIAESKTGELWKRFMPYKKQIENHIPDLHYSVEIYPTGYFDHFDPQRLFVKWAAVAAQPESSPPESMESLSIPGGLYAIFRYKGRPEEASSFYWYIFSEWLPQSDYQLDHRPHFSLMGKEYRNADPQSEEDIYIPVVKE